MTENWTIDTELGEVQQENEAQLADPQHRPLGAINRIRRLAYEAVSKRHHELNNTPRREPSPHDVETSGM